ncbi:MAG: HD domain-containing protein [Candidatus Cloacimonetes bacterium]|nr:HD domain-containing protein [Candidatus Cloacimonadota bacterium]
MKKIEQIISEAIIGTEFENKTYIVGGYVRDKIMGIQNQDMDIVVENKNGGEGLACLLYRKNISTRPVIYENFGTASVMIDDHKIEFVMSRKESYRDKDRKPEVQLGTLRDDIFRRDFTINSLVMNIISGEIKDLSGKGISDIKNRIIRSTSDPEVIFGEDPLRMLRAIRFSVKSGFEIESETEKGIRNNSPKLKHISWERRRDELIKMLKSDEPVWAINLLYDYDLMRNLIPEFEKLRNLQQGKCHNLDAFDHSLSVLELTEPNLELRLSALLHDIGKPEVVSEDESGIHFYKHDKVGSDIAGKILKRLKFSSSQIVKVKFLISNHMRLKSFGKNGELVSDKAIRKLIYQSGDNLEILLKLIHADNQVHAENYKMPNQIPEIRKRITKIRKVSNTKKLPLNGKDIMDRFKIESGKKVGEFLSEASEIWFEHPDWEKERILDEIEKETKSTKFRC